MKVFPQLRRRFSQVEEEFKEKHFPQRVMFSIVLDIHDLAFILSNI